MCSAEEPPCPALSVEVPAATGARVALRPLVAACFAPEHGVTRRCEAPGCGGQAATLRARVAAAPRALLIHLKRFSSTATPPPSDAEHGTSASAFSASSFSSSFAPPAAPLPHTQSVSRFFGALPRPTTLKCCAPVFPPAVLDLDDIISSTDAAAAADARRAAEEKSAADAAAAVEAAMAAASDDERCGGGDGENAGGEQASPRREAGAPAPAAAAAPPRAAAPTPLPPVRRPPPPRRGIGGAAVVLSSDSESESESDNENAAPRRWDGDAAARKRPRLSDGAIDAAAAATAAAAAAATAAAAAAGGGDSPPQPRRRPRLVYDLTGVVSHSGPMATSGHYTADVRDPTTGQWSRHNDEFVHNISLNDVINDWRKATEAYIFMYTLREDPSGGGGGGGGGGGKRVSDGAAAGVDGGEAPLALFNAAR